MKEVTVIVVALMLYSFQAEARPGGAPASTCSTLMPRHAPNQAGSDPFPYEVDLSTLADGYEGGKSYGIQLRGTSRDGNFRGFLIQARTTGDGSAVGSFDSGTQHKQLCTNETAATHKNNQQKRTVGLEWTAPSAGTGPINFWFSFVDIHRGKSSRFWAREMSDVVNEACPIKGQIRQQCASHPSCHQACDTTGPTICPAICIVNGCQCPNGTVIDKATNECVAPNKCTACPIKGQIRQQCASHPSCHQACDTTGPTICPAICIVNGCQCPNGTVIDKATNECVAPNKCTGVCPVKGQVQKNCTSTCQTTCITRFHFRACILVCHNESRCVCPEGTVIDEDRNECVSPDECPEIPCPVEGQSYSSNCRQINATCSNPSTPAICDFPMCACPLGQVIDENLNKCVNISECSCPIKGQVRKQCASHPDCHQKCNNNVPIACPEICIINGCECPNGTVIDEDKNECVTPSQCEATCPIEGQFLTTDCYGINATCSVPNPARICDLPQCVCPRGQVIDTAGKTCISGTECSNPCDIRRISGRARYRNNRRRLILKFSSNRHGKRASYVCQIDNRGFRHCTSPMTWRNLTLQSGQHSVTVRGSCTYNGGVTSTSSRSFSFQV